MKLITRSLVYLLPCVSAFVLFGCKTPPLSPGVTDATAPEFVQVLVRLEAPAAPNPRAEFDVAYRDIIRNNIGSDIAIRVIALAGDPQSGISNLSIESNLT